MKKIITMVVASGFMIAANAQTDVNLKLNHYWNGNEFNYGETYTSSNGNAVSISRVQYYLSGIDLTHDNAQNTSMDQYVLASGNITNYSLGTATFTSLEAIDFDLGIDAATNHLDPTTYADSDPLSMQNPSMHWGWTAGYRFLVIEGLVDSDDDGTPDKSFQFHVTADDDYLKRVNAIETAGELNSGILDINIDVNIADWVKGINLITAGFNHGVYALNETVVNNTNTHTVFNSNIGLSINDNYQLSNNIYFDYSISYAPTIFYKIPAANSITIEITDINGRVVLTEGNLANAGNYFINKELVSGTYITKFITDNGNVLSNKFIVQQ